MKARSAISLGELLVVMSLCSVVLTMSMQIIQRAMQAHLRAKEYLSIERNVLRLSRQFRCDVHEATEASLISENPDTGLAGEAVVSLPSRDGNVIQYRRTARGILRVVLSGEEVAAREEFRLPPSCDLRLEEAPTPRRLVLSITSGPTTVPRDEGPAFDAHAIPLQFHAEAVLGRNGGLDRLPAEEGL
jgi:hypothetical protein